MFEEHKYEELKKLGTELHIPIFEAFLKMEVLDGDGKLVQEHSQRSHSWVRNAYNMMFSSLAGKDADDSTFEAGKLSGKDTNGLVAYGDYPFAFYLGKSISPYGNSADGTGMGYRCVAGSDTYGIQVGSGTNAESFEDYALQTKIADGASGGELNYVLSQAHSITYTGGTKVLKNDLVRYFNNNSGGSIGVNEVGIVVRVARITGPVNLGYFLMSRDKLGATVTVADTGQLKTTYTIQISFPS